MGCPFFDLNQLKNKYILEQYILFDYIIFAITL